MRLRRLYIFSMLLIFVHYLSAQTSQLKKLLPMIAPSSPEVASLGKFGTYQVSHFTGVPDISIPIYEVQVGELRLPIALSYHASGIKVSEMPSRAGLGWSLNAGGTITRKIQGLPDEHVNNYFSATSTSEYRVKVGAEIEPNTATGLDYLGKINARKYDVEPDIFSYSFPGQSGKFLFNQKDNFSPYLIPFAPVLITKTQVNPYSVNFSIKDDAGRKYLYNKTEVTSSGSGVGLQANTTSAWLMSEMISANGQDSIRFKYTMVTTSDQYHNEYQIVNHNVTGDGYYNLDNGTFGGEYVGVTTNSQQLNEITFPGGKVTFHGASEGRHDFGGVIYALQNRLQFIKVYNYDPASNSYTPIKVYQLFHSYFMDAIANSKRLRLDSIQVQTSSNSPVQTYRFSYNTSIALPDNLSKQKDFWGYFNNNQNMQPGTNTRTAIPKMEMDYLAPPSAPTKKWIGGTDINARYPNPLYNQACILQQINFPTGGYTQFTYETNQYIDENGAAKYAGGLRVKTIKSYDGVNDPIVKTYKYGTSESGYGRANFVLEQYFFANHQPYQWVEPFFYPNGQCKAPLGTKTMSTFFANPTNDLEGWDGAPVVYPTVTEYQGDETTNLGKTVYQYSDNPDARTSIIGFGKPYYDSYHFMRGLLTNKSVFRKNGDGTYTIVSEERKKYQYFFPYQWSTGGVGLVVAKRVARQNSAGDIDNIGVELIAGCGAVFTDQNNYNYNNYNIVSGDNKLVEDIIIVYDQLNTGRYASTTATYTYNDLEHLGLTQVQTKNSKGEDLQTNYTYPYNYTTAPYTNMNNAHIWDKVITETKYSSGTQITQQTTNYAPFSGNNFLPSSIQTKIKANPVETRASFNNYDMKGDILEMQKANDVKQSYLWGYSNTYPIAQAVNAKHNEIFFDSFEEGGTWNGVVLDPTRPRAGRYAARIINQTAGEVTYHSTKWLNVSLAQTTKFKYSGWVYSTGPSAEIFLFMKRAGETAYFTHVSSALVTQTNKWVYVEGYYDVPSNITQLNIRIDNNGTGTVWFDDIRLHPDAAQMTTYTYDPLVGVTSETDINNRTTYYQYDEFQRLVLVRDHDRNILKKFCYNYAGQTETCHLFLSEDRSGSYTRNDCGSGYTGGSHYVDVPAGMFASTLSLADANAKATQYGQEQANLYGTCTENCSLNPATNFSFMTSTLSKSGTTVSFYIVFSYTGTLYAGSTYTLATINGPCKPSSGSKTATATAGGRTWSLVFSNSGQVTVQITGGGNLAPQPPATQTPPMTLSGSFTQ